MVTKNIKTKLHFTKSEDFLEWWSQGITLGLIRYDGKLLEKPSSKRFVNWWLTGLSFGFLKVKNPVGLDKGDSIVDNIFRRFSLSLIAYGEVPTSVLHENKGNKKK